MGRVITDLSEREAAMRTRTLNPLKLHYTRRRIFNPLKNIIPREGQMKRRRYIYVEHIIYKRSGVVMRVIERIVLKLFNRDIRRYYMERYCVPL